MTRRHVRALRGVAAAWVATTVAASAHTLAGGGPPSPALVAAIGILASPFAVALIGRRLSAWRVGAAVLAAQTFFHVAFAVAGGATPSGSESYAGSSVHSHHLGAVGGGMAGAVVPDAAMLAGHALAALATVIALYAGERMLRALGRGIRSVLSRARAITPFPQVLRLVPTAAREARAWGILLSDLSRRGPPAFVFAAR